ncbi:hypothetical protein [Massilia oculi]|uniref:hypothetical protein n=1 Tax=Massilia oculi TaxID=945844 RepID=UPI0028ACFC42|nr:hypothetical protein [Massilia oculi]
MNLDRALALLGVIIGLLGAAAGIYVSQKDYNMGLLLASGWVAAALVGLTIATLAFRAITAMEKSHSNAMKVMADTQADALRQLTSARDDVTQRYDGLLQESNALKAEVTEFRNISRALSAVVNGEDKPKPPRPQRRPKVPAYQVEKPNRE